MATVRWHVCVWGGGGREGGEEGRVAAQQAWRGSAVAAGTAAMQRRAGECPAWVRRPPSWTLQSGAPKAPAVAPNPFPSTSHIHRLYADLWSGQVQVLVMNNNPDGHPEFERLKARAERGDDAFAVKARRYVKWLDNPGTCKDPTPDAADPDDLNNPTSRPGR